MRLRRLAGLVRRLKPATLLRAAAGGATLLLLAGGTLGTAGQVRPEGLTVQLQKGWNNVPYYGPTAAPEAALAPIAGSYSAVYYWDAVQQRYLAYRPADAAGSDLTRLEAGRAYWIVATAVAVLNLPPPVPGAVPALAPGWNNLVYTGPPAPVPEAFAILAGRYTAVYGWDAALQRFRKLAPREGDGSPAMLAPYGCYWLDFA